MKKITSGVWLLAGGQLLSKSKSKEIIYTVSLAPKHLGDHYMEDAHNN